ncbi:hypothetical protein LMG27174_06610 [Paraburkholderia rhynchosiae]|uniref:Uncharacterized protein n=1 Tax=Paraburkholderia rhynchosiae TaxID=487049 RepID=A0A6J5CNR1_9BURK|nr:hypothetical protein LMG27174_06610 [Paraburkholderia rhynchosiae]
MFAQRFLSNRKQNVFAYGGPRLRRVSHRYRLVCNVPAPLIDTASCALASNGQRGRLKGLFQLIGRTTPLQRLRFIAGRLRSGGKTHQLPSLWRKKMRATRAAPDAPSTRTNLCCSSRPWLNCVTRTLSVLPIHFSITARNELPERLTDVSRLTSYNRLIGAALFCGEARLPTPTPRAGERRRSGSKQSAFSVEGLNSLRSLSDHDESLESHRRGVKSAIMVHW